MPKTKAPFFLPSINVSEHLRVPRGKNTSRTFERSYKVKIEGHSNEAAATFLHRRHRTKPPSKQQVVNCSTSPLQLLQLEELAISARGARRDLRLCLRLHHRRCLGLRGSPPPSATTSTSMSSTSTTSTTCEAYLTSTSQEGLGVYWRTRSS